MGEGGEGLFLQIFNFFSFLGREEATTPRERREKRGHRNSQGQREKEEKERGKEGVSLRRREIGGLVLCVMVFKGEKRGDDLNLESYKILFV